MDMLMFVTWCNYFTEKPYLTPSNKGLVLIKTKVTMLLPWYNGKYIHIGYICRCAECSLYATFIGPAQKSYKVVKAWLGQKMSAQCKFLYCS